MNSMCHVTDCNFEGAKTLKLSEKTPDFGRLLQFFGKKTRKMHKNLAGVVFFHYMNFINSPDIGQIAIQKPNTNSMKCYKQISTFDRFWANLYFFKFKNMADFGQILCIKFAPVAF